LILAQSDGKAISPPDPPSTGKWAREITLDFSTQEPGKDTFEFEKYRIKPNSRKNKVKGSLKYYLKGGLPMLTDSKRGQKEMKTQESTGSLKPNNKSEMIGQ